MNLYHLLFLPLTVFLLAAIHPIANGQQLDPEKHVCGFHPDEEHIERLMNNLERAEALDLQRSGVTFFIPLQFHLIARNDGTGGREIKDVLDQMCTLNENYAPYNIQFFLKDNSVNFINNTSAFNDPSNTPVILNNNRDLNAVNIYFADNTINTPGPNTTLGYYSPSFDWIVMRNDMILNHWVLSHEIGHFFSLMHTFFGWEQQPYNSNQHGNPVNLTTAPNGFTPVELANGSNCNTAADRLCDTPPDYNFGATWGAGGGCAPFTLQIRDRNNDLVQPMQNNYMSYFFNCQQYQFTPMQVNAMQSDILSTQRSHLRDWFDLPNMAEISDNVTPLSPTNGGTSTYYDEVNLMWNEVENATAYYIEIATSPEPFFNNNVFIKELVSSNQITLTGLSPNSQYFYKVRPMNETYYCTSLSTDFSFRTSDIPVDIELVQEPQFNVSSAMNPIHRGEQPVLVFQNDLQTEHVSFSVYSVNGQLIHSEKVDIYTGFSRVKLNTELTRAGVYFIEITSDNFRDVKQVVVQ